MLNLLDWLLWWRLDKEKVEWQAKNYNRLEFFDSFKALSLLLILASVALSALSLFRVDAPIAPAAELLLLTMLGLLVYGGHRWAMIAAMLLWTLEKGLQFLVHPLSIVLGIFWWALVMHPLFGALAVENLRRKMPVGS